MPPVCRDRARARDSSERTAGSVSEQRGGSSGRVGLEESQAALCRAFVGWQCRLRQLAVRHDGGRPSEAMRPSVSLEDGRALGQVTVLLVKREPDALTAQFRHMVLKTQDPQERYQNALRLLAAEYYQRPEEFSDQLTALFAQGSQLCALLLQAQRCVLEFDQWNESYRIPCQVRPLEDTHPAYQATYWHNRLFNPAMPGDMTGLAFLPDWSAATRRAPD